IFIDNAFPITLVKQSSPVRCLDVSCDRRKLAVVNESATLMVYDLETQQLLYQEAGANSVAWNQEFADMVAYSGNNLLCIKTGSFPSHPQKLHGFVVGFKGSKIFCLNFSSMETIEIPQGPSLYRQDVNRRYLEDLAKRQWTDEDRALVAAHALAYEGRFNEAAVLFGRAKQYGLATEMFTDLRRWDDAKKWAELQEKAVQNGEIEAPKAKEPGASENREDNANLATGGGEHGVAPQPAPSTTVELMMKQAQSSEEDGDLRAAADTYLRVGQRERAAGIYMRIGALEPLIDIVRSCDKNNERDEEIMLEAAACFIKHDNYMFAKEALTRAEDYESLVRLHVNEHRWEEAFQLARSHPELAEDIFLPWGNWLMSNDRYEEAYEAFEKAGRSDLSSEMLRQLMDLSAEQKLFKQAAIYAWKKAKSAAVRGDVDGSIQSKVQSDVYLAYSDVVSHIEGPLVLTPLEQTLHACVFITNMASQIGELPLGVKRSNVLFVLAETAIKLQCFKLARSAHDRLESVKLPRQLAVKAQYSTLKSRSATLVDNDDLVQLCGRCGSTLPYLISFDGSSSTEVIELEHCTECLHPLIRSAIGWEPLPLLEFEAADESLDHNEVIGLVESEPRYSSGLRDRQEARGKELRDQQADRLVLDSDDGRDTASIYDVDSELLRTIVTSVRDLVPGEPYKPTRLPTEILRELRPEEILVIDQIRKGMGIKWNSVLRVQKNSSA
ncbi:hypothetical protein FOZ62_023579, partial [Perkinsus olseni]